jgi:hypothetical protein
VSNLLLLANEPGEITWRGVSHKRSSMIDLTWYNNAAIEDAVFSNWTLDWEGSLGSDHALTRVQGSLIGPTQPPQEEGTNLGHVIDEEKGVEWHQQFKATMGSPAHLLEKPMAEQVDELARQVYEAMQHATTQPP